MTSASTLFMPGAAFGGATAARAGTPPTPPAPSRGFSQALREAQAQPTRDAQRPRERDISETREREEAAEPAEADREERDRTSIQEPTPAELSAQELVLAFVALPAAPAEATGQLPANAAAEAGTDGIVAALAADGATAQQASLANDAADEAASDTANTAGVTKKDAPLAATDTAAVALGETADEDVALAHAQQDAQGQAPAARAAAPQRAAEAPLPLAAMQAATSAGPTVQDTASSGVARQVDVPADSPDFPEALATQVGYLVRDGVQQARLTLNPAEMGSVTVQIAVQGQQAQVDFAAASAATRAALENSLSHLAAALQEAGLTLSGGGVSQQHEPRQQPGQEHTPHTHRRGGVGLEDGSGTHRASTTPGLRRADGRLDLYA
ncbi:MAG TPA: flagellar hook-length control protein FliK [Ramlibacter sp.]|nr:flagellar hook-length control protein FliK [Ramlibacter sp.]